MFLALREARRSPGRFVLLVGAVALLVLLLLFFQSVASSLTSGLTGGVANNAADVLVYSDTARRNPAASFIAPELADQVSEVDGVAGVTLAGRLAIEVAGADAVVIGLDPPASGGPAELEAGQRAEGRGEAVFSGSSLTESFAIDETVEVAGVELLVVGETADAAFDVSPTFYVTFDDYAAIVQAQAGREVEAPVSWLGVSVGDGAEPATVAAAITSGVDGVEALEREAAAAALPGVDQITRSFSILYLLLFIVVTIVTGVFFLILTVQKQSSLVLLRAIGARRRDVVAPVLLQVLAVVGAGSLLGTAVAAGLLRAAREQFGSSLDPTTTAATIAIIVGLGVLASIGSVRRVLTVDPIEATMSGTV